MNYEIRWESRAQRQLRSLPSHVIKRIVGMVEGLSDNPRPRGAIKLAGTATDGWRVRVGDYRILYEIDDGNRLVTIFRIGHRGDVYR